MSKPKTTIMTWYQQNVTKYIKTKALKKVGLEKRIMSSCYWQNCIEFNKKKHYMLYL